MLSIVLQAGGGSPISMLLMFGGIFAVMYFFMILPQQKKQKAQKLFQDNLAKGAEIVTLSGIHGTIAKVNDNNLQLEISKGVIITVEKSVVSQEITEAVYGKK